ncbi:MAG TPA: response regulator transcription factor [Thermoleophilaceae bacterium]|jgi:DNA-binding NarL/FixJ family response regulator
MGSVTVLETAIPVEDRAVVVWLVANDHLIRSRAAAALAFDHLLVPSQADDIADLPSEAEGSTDAVVIACMRSAEDRTAAIRAAKLRQPNAHVVIVATADSNGVHRALEAGADGFVFEAGIETTLGPTVRAVCAGQVVVPPAMRASVVRPALTHREKQTLGLAVLGLTNAEIGQRLFLAESTVKCHMTSIFSKLGVRSRSEAAAQVLDPQNGLGMGILRLSPGTENGT